jgi:hypothetical protein
MDAIQTKTVILEMGRVLAQIGLQTSNLLEANAASLPTPDAAARHKSAQQIRQSVDSLIAMFAAIG